MVTGGTRGIGWEIASWFAADGATVALCSRHAADAERAAARLKDQYGVMAVGSGCDVSEPGQVDAWIDQLLESFGRLDVAVANAAVLGPVGPLTEVDMCEWARAVNVDVVGVAAVVSAALRPMLAAGWGRVVILSGGGVGGPNPIVRTSAYAASKAAVTVLAEVVAAEVKDRGITVNAVSPGGSRPSS
jgi:NAD(P)-dependent dehydrogenase (short-subunit alcohol dehydrogenase family)